MRICVISEFSVPYYNGGGERRYYEMMKRVVKLGHEVDMITMNYPNCKKHEQIDGINIHHIGPTIENPPIRSKTDFIKFFYSICKWLLKHDYDVLDAQSYSPLLPTTIMSKIKKTPLIGTVYDTSTNNKDQWIQSSTLANRVEKFLVTLPFTKLLTVSNSTKTSLINDFEVKGETIEILSIGFDTDFVDSIKCEEKNNNTIIFVGRLIPHKHVNHLLKVINKLKNKIPDIKLVIVGKGIEKDNLIKYITDNYLEEHVEFLQDLSNEELTYQMKKSNVLVLPSTREGFGMVLAEANSCNIPVIAYKSGGVVEVINSGNTGYLIEPENVEELTSKIELVLTNKKLQEKLGKQGRKHVEKKFNWDKIVNQYIQLLENIVK